MGNKQKLIFQPSDNELEFIEDRGISWSAFCHRWLDKERGLIREEKLDYIGNKLLIILIGIACIIFTFVINNLLVLVVTSMCGVVAICIGTFSLLRRYRNER